MNHLTMKLPELPIITDSPEFDLNTRWVEIKGVKFKETKSANRCCVCGVNFWVQDRAFLEGFKVLDGRAYESGVAPDYLKDTALLKECHYGECATKLYASFVAPVVLKDLVAKT